MIVQSTVTPDGFDTIGGHVGVCSTCPTKVDPDRRHLTVIAADCFQNAARDVEVFASGADKDTVRAYVAGPLPSRDATMTDASGLVVFLNMPVGPTDITIRPKGFAVVGTRTVFIRKGLFTGVFLGPTP